MSETRTKSDVDPVELIATKIITGIRGQIGAAWNDLPVADRETIAECAMDAAELQLMSLAAMPAQAEALADEKRQIDAQLANLAAIASLDAAAISQTFWGVVQDGAMVALKIALR